MKLKTLTLSIASAALLSGCAGNMGLISDQQWHDAQADAQASAEQLVAQMSDREQIGQLLMMDFRDWGKDPYSQEPLAVTSVNPDIASIVHDYHIGGVILFRQNVVNTEQTFDFVSDLQAARSNIPMFISIDQEGGYVTRLQEGTEMPGNMALAATGDAKWAYEAGRVHGAELSSMGINYNFGPVVDVNVAQSNPVIGVRSYGSDQDTINKMAAAYMDGIHQYGMTTSIKHFPGHGNVSVDSHYEMPVVDYSREEWEKVDLAPFKAAIENGADSIMTAHVSLPSVDNGQLYSEKTAKEIAVPATFSEKILTGILRDEVGFDGLIITDALDMGAISENFDTTFAVKQAISAGADIALMPLQITSREEIAELEALYKSLEEEMDASPEFRQRVTESAVRVVRTKLEKGLLNQPAQRENAKLTVASDANKAMEAGIAERSITLIENQQVLPVATNEITKVLVISDEASRNGLIESELRNIAGESPMYVNRLNFPLTGDDVSESMLNKNIEQADLVIMATYNLTGDAPNAQKVIDISNKQNVRTVVISSRNPYDIAHLSGVKANLAIYGITGFDVTNADRNSLEANIRAGVRTLFADANGQALNTPHGKLPVEIRAENGELLYPLGHSKTY